MTQFRVYFEVDIQSCSLQIECGNKVGRVWENIVLSCGNIILILKNYNFPNKQQFDDKFFLLFSG